MKRNLLAVFVLGVASIAGVAGQGGQPASPQPPAQPAAQPVAPQPEVTFRTEVNYVEVDARVLDAQGRFVSDLKPGDFQVLEEGKPQKVTIFSLINLPVERAERPLFASKPIEPDVQTNTRITEGRVYLLVLDDLHTHPLRSTRVRAAARQFVERYLGANDMAAVVTTGGTAQGSQDFTNNPRLLVAAIDKFMGRKLRSSTQERIDEEFRTRDTRQSGDRINDPLDMERGFNARNALSTIKSLAEYMENVRGRRKALVFFSEGIDYDINDVFNNREATTVLDSTRDAIAAATRGNVSIYGVDVRGLNMMGDESIEIQSFPDDPSLGLSPSTLQNELRLSQDSLRVLSEETGGFAVVNTNDIAGSFQRVVDDNSAYYVLGYYPANDRRDGRFRKIEVKVNRPGLTVRARRGYVAPRGRAADRKAAGPESASPELRDAMSSPLPVSSLPMAVTAAVFKGPAPNGSVVISVLVGGRDLPLEQKDGLFHNTVEVAFVAVNSANGKSFNGDRNTMNLALKPDSVPRVRAAGFRMVSSMELPPGKYQLHVGARESNSKRAGSVLYDLDVPDFTKEPLTMSGIALTSGSSTLAPTARPKDPLTSLLPGPLTSYREFPQNDEVAVFTEVYDANVKQPHKVSIAMTVKAEGGSTVLQTREERDTSELAGSAGGFGFTNKFVMTDFAPGLYVLRIEAQSRIGDQPTVARELVFRVVPGPPQTTSTRTPSTNAPAPTGPGKPPVPARSEPAPAGAPVSMTTIASDSMSAIDAAREAVARTQADFDTLWRQHAPGRSAPTVDFAKNMVVAVFLGSRPSSGFQAEITAVQREGDALVVRWAEIRPGPDQMAAQVMTAPAHLVVVPRFDGQVRFQKVEARPR